MLQPRSTALGRLAPLGAVLLGAVFFIGVGNAHAANFSITPIIGDIAPDSSIAVFQVQNRDSRALSVQIQAYEWTQIDGQDVRVAATDLIVVPPIATVDPGQTQLVRIALRGDDRTREHAYRVMVREIPRAAPNGGGAALTTVLTFDVPLFFAPQGGERRFEWRIGRGGDGAPALLVRSTGSRFTRFDHIRVVDRAGQDMKLGGPLYVLAGAQRSWPLPASLADALKHDTELTLIYSIGGRETSIPLGP